MNCKVCALTHKPTHTEPPYTTVSVAREFITHSCVPGVPGLPKYPPPPTIAAHSNQPAPQLQQRDAEVSSFLQTSCREVTSCTVVFLRLLSRPTQWSPLQGLVGLCSSRKTTLLFCISTFLWFLSKSLLFSEACPSMRLISPCFVLVYGLGGILTLPRRPFHSPR